MARETGNALPMILGSCSIDERSRREPEVDASENRALNSIGFWMIEKRDETMDEARRASGLSAPKNRVCLSLL